MAQSLAIAVAMDGVTFVVGAAGPRGLGGACLNAALVITGSGQITRVERTCDQRDK
jgi:hypothetical protein